MMLWKGQAAVSVWLWGGTAAYFGTKFSPALSAVGFVVGLPIGAMHTRTRTRTPTHTHTHTHTHTSTRTLSYIYTSTHTQM